MMLTTKGRYAVMAMVDLAYYGGSSRTISLQDIGDRQEIALNYLEQIFSKLKKGYLVLSTKGPGGGYRLSRDAKDISILDIINAVGENIQITRCEKGKLGCLESHNKKCFTHSLWGHLTDNIMNYLHSRSLQDICDEANKGR